MSGSSLCKELVSLGFTQLESDIYVTLLEKGDLSGYQLSKLLGVTRSSVYPVLETLYTQGVLQLIPGDVNIYSARDPEQLIIRMKNDYLKQAEKALSSLKNVKKDSSEKRFLNIKGFENIIAKSNYIISKSKTEILINSDYDLDYFKVELAKAIKRKVRVIVFSWSEISIANLKLEYFTRSNPVHTCGENRILIVSDLTTALVSGTIGNDLESFKGFYSQNRLTTHIITEHILFDIYLIKLMKKTKKDIITKDIQIGSLLEKLL